MAAPVYLAEMCVPVAAGTVHHSASVDSTGSMSKTTEDVHFLLSLQWQGYMTAHSRDCLGR